MNKKIINIDKEDNYRIVAISDIHGHLDYFKNLLTKVNLKEEDYLIIIGDFINRGPDSYQTCEYLKKLQNRPNTIILKGNHESFIYESMNNTNLSTGFLRFLHKKQYRTLINDLAEMSGFDIESCESGIELHDYMKENYSKVFSFIDELPTLAYCDEFIFVHGGYNSNFDIEKDENRFLKFDNYNELSQVNKQTIVVGHWPASNLRKESFKNRPLFNNEKNIISIDGGVGVKTSGELNALIIEKKNGLIDYKYIQENDFQKRIIKKEYTFIKEEKTFVSYPDFEVEIIKAGDPLTLCRHISTNKLLSVFNCLLETNGEIIRIKTTYINNFLNVKIGTEVELCLEFEDCALVKYHDEFGWIRSFQI